jgi:hypothetical protein
MGNKAPSAVEFPFTPLRLSTVPMRMPTASVNRITREESAPWALMRASKVEKREFILKPSFNDVDLTDYKSKLFARKRNTGLEPGNA